MIGSVLLLFLTFAGTLWLETQLKANFMPELFLVCVGVFVAFLLIVGESTKRRWVWRWSTIFYAVAMGNLAFLFLATKNLLVFAATLLIVVIGFIRAVSRLEMDHIVDPSEVSTYEMGSDVITPDTLDPIIVQTTPARKKKTRKKRKKSRKKSSRRR